MIILGIESTAHTFGVGVVKNGKVLANVKKSFVTEKGGLIPTEVAKHHFENKNEIYFEALKNAGIAPLGVPQTAECWGKEKDIDAVAFSQGPGLAPCLLEGMKFAKEICKKLKVPLVPVNHCIAHLEIGKIVGAKDSVMLYASGANTQVIAYEAGKYRIFGETLDLGAGNFIDTFARYAGLGFPGGPKIEKLALSSENYIELPYKVKGMDIALSGILTNLRQKIESNKYKIEDLCFSMQEIVFAMLVETAERALAHTGKKELLLAGGVACNSRLQEMCEIMCRERGAHHGRTPKDFRKKSLQGAKFFVPEKSLLVDNGAMIAYLGEIMFKKKIFEKNLEKIDIKPRQRTDEIQANWK